MKYFNILNFNKNKIKVKHKHIFDLNEAKKF